MTHPLLALRTSTTTTWLCLAASLLVHMIYLGFTEFEPRLYALASSSQLRIQLIARTEAATPTQELHNELPRQYASLTTTPTQQTAAPTNTAAPSAKPSLNRAQTSLKQKATPKRSKQTKKSRALTVPKASVQTSRSTLSRKKNPTQLAKKDISLPHTHTSVSKQKAQLPAHTTEAQISPSAQQAAAPQKNVIYQANYRKKMPPQYPPRSLRFGHEGTVLLHAKVAPTGMPSQLHIQQSSGHRLLDEAALAAVKQWKFIPTQVNGSVTSSWVRVPVRFVIQ